MELDFAFICDYADAGGKLSALGIGIDTIHAAGVPVTHPQFHFVSQLRYSVAEAGQKDIAIRLIDADGVTIGTPIEASMPFPQPPQGNLEATGRIAVAFNNVTFPHFGAYAIHLLISGHEICRVALRIAEPPAAASA